MVSQELKGNLKTDISFTQVFEMRVTVASGPNQFLYCGFQLKSEVQLILETDKI